MIAENWFRHDVHAHGDDKLIRLRREFGPAGYGVFWLMVEYMHSHDGEIADVGDFAFTMNVEIGLAERIVKATLDLALTLPLAGGTGCLSPRVKNQLETRREYLAKQREFGKVGGQQKAKKVGYPKATPKGRSSQGEERRAEEKREERTTVVLDPKTISLLAFIDEECKASGIANAVNARALDVQVRRYQDMQLRVETRKCLTWLIEHGQKQITAMRLANWFQKAAEINKREENRRLDRNLAAKDPHVAAQVRARGEKPEAVQPFAIDPMLKAKILNLPPSPDGMPDVR